MNNLRSILIAALAILVLGNIGHAQAPAPDTGLYLEVVNKRNPRPALLQVPPADRKFSGVWGPFAPLPSWSAPADFLPVKNVNVLARMEGDAVRVKVSVFLGKKTHEKEEQVASFLARENEKVTITELKRWGVVPFEITVVKVSSSALGSPPEVLNKTKAIAVINIEPVGLTPATFRVVVRNLSAKYVSALSMTVLLNNQKGLSGMPAGEEGRHLIEPGGVWKADDFTHVKIDHTPGGYVLNTADRQTVVIGTVIFEDGSYEGEVQPAVTFRGFSIGRKQQLARVIALFKSALETVDTDPASRLAKLRADVASLEINAEPAEIDKVLTDIPAYGPNRDADARRAIEVVLAGVRKDVTSNIDAFREQRRQNLDTVALQTWLNATKERYETWLSRLQSF